MYNEKYGDTLGVIDDDFSKEQMYRIYYFIKNNCDDKDIQDRIKMIHLDKPKTLEQQLTKLESENSKDIDPTIKKDINNIKSEVNELNTQYKDIANEKMDKNTTDISISQIDINNGKITQNYLSDELLQQMAGNTPINSIPKRKSILLEHESWLDVVKLNLFDINTATLGTVMNSNGYTSEDETYLCSDFIPVEEGRTYFNSASLSGAYFDEKKGYVEGLNAGFSNPFTVPTAKNIKYVRLTYRQDKSNILCEGNAILDKNARFGDIKISWSNETFLNLLTETIKNTEINNTAWAEITGSPNLYNPANSTSSKYVVPNNGWTSDDTNWCCSEFIKINPSTKYSKTNNGGYAFYTYASANNYISGGSGTNIISPENANYIRVSVKSTDNQFMLVEGDSLPSEYLAYGSAYFTLKEKYKDEVLNTLGNKKLPTEGLNMLVFGDSITETATVSDDGATYTEGTNTNWVTYSKKALKIGELWNYAKAGAAYRDRDDVLLRQKISHQITTAIANKRPADIIVISAGTNDWQKNLGDFDTAMSKKTLNDLDRTYFYEAIRWAFWTLKTNYPDAICFVATPIQRAEADPFTQTIEAIIKMAERYNFIVIPAHAESGIIKEFEVINGQGRYLYDGLHPDTNGKKLMSKLYDRVILNALENYF